MIIVGKDVRQENFLKKYADRCTYHLVYDNWITMDQV